MRSLPTKLLSLLKFRPLFSKYARFLYTNPLLNTLFGKGVNFLDVNFTTRASYVFGNFPRNNFQVLFDNDVAKTALNVSEIMSGKLTTEPRAL